MRFDTLVGVYKMEKVKDGQGGYVEKKTFYKSLYANKSYLTIEKQIQVFGVANYESLKLITLEAIEADKFCIRIGDVYYKPMHKPKVVRNKTYITLDVLEHAD